MGFKRKLKVYKLVFEDTEYEGLEVKIRGLTTGEYLDLIALTGPTDADENEATGMLNMFAEHLISWNLEDEEGNPVPATFEGLKANDFTMNSVMLNAWTEAIANVPMSTEKKSPTGDVTLLESIPTETLP